MADTFHLKYRPASLDDLLGHEVAVTRLKGIIASNKYPNALLFTGLTSVGKTTLARCFAADVLKTDNVEKHPDYLEQNAGSDGGIDNIRELIQVASLNPMKGKKRFLVIDEAQRLTGAAAQAILKPLEQPPKNTVFILCSMEPEKFAAGAGRAIANRCSQFALEPPTTRVMGQYVMRIVKGEKLRFEDTSLLKNIVHAANGEMRVAASILESVAQFAAANPKQNLSEKDILNVLKDSASSDDDVAIRILTGVYTQKFSVVQKAVLDAADAFGLINKLLYLNSYMLNQHVLKGQKHPKVWPSASGKELVEVVDKLASDAAAPHLGQSINRLTTYAKTQTCLVSIRQEAASFLVPEQNLISARLYELVASLKEAMV